MEDKSFNLISEPWIRVETLENQIVQQSIREVLENSQKDQGLAGELPTQNAAVLRMLLAIVHTVVTRFNSDGEDSPLESQNDAYRRWAEIWDAGKLPEKAVNHYLDQVYDRFWLVHPEHPFMQAPIAKVGTVYPTSKLIGSIGESNNKLRLFQSRSGEEKQQIPLDEAARWIIYLNGFDDSSNKAKFKTPGVKPESPGVGWLGKIGQIYAVGENLFETIMLNLPLVRNNELFGKDHPYWEKDEEPKERKRIIHPDNLAELWTLPSRRIWLDVKDDVVTGYRLLSGDFFSEENSIIEQNTVWKKAGGAKKSDKEVLLPRTHNSSRQIWRDFSLISGSGAEGAVLPGVVAWIKALKDRDLIPQNKPITFEVPFVEYDSKKCSITDSCEQTMIIFPALFTEAGEEYRELAADEVKKLDELAFYTGLLAAEISQASGNNDKSSTTARDRGSVLAYSAFDAPFKSWLASMDPDGDEEPEVLEDRWHQEIKKVANSLVKKLTANLPAKALVGRKVTIKDKNKNEKEVIYSAPHAVALFWHRFKQLYGAKEEGDAAVCQTK